MKKRLVGFLAALMLTLFPGCAENEAGTGHGAVTPPLWEVTDDSTGGHIYLMGAIHTGYRDTVYPDYVYEALSGSDYAAFEMDTLSFREDAELQSSVIRHLLLDGTEASAVMGDSYGDIVSFFKKKGVYNSYLEGTIPYYWASVLSGRLIAECGMDSDFGSESLLIKKARELGKPVREVEGAEAQYAMMGELPLSVQLSSVTECVGDENYALQKELLRELFGRWSEFDDEYFRKTADDLLAQSELSDDLMTFYSMMYSDRQRIMADFVKESLEKGEQGFFLVGTLHYYAEPSIITLLEESGYTIREIRPAAAEAAA